MSIFDTIEFSEEIETLVDKLEQESNERQLSREERALIDVLDTVKLIEEGSARLITHASATHSSSSAHQPSLILSTPVNGARALAQIAASTRALSQTIFLALKKSISKHSRRCPSSSKPSLKKSSKRKSLLTFLGIPD
jgi:predicted phosphoribosyltransferase